MANDTWNFAVHQAQDFYSSPSGRGYASGIYYSTLSSRFQTNFTAIFAFLARDGWTEAKPGQQRIMSIATQGQSGNTIDLWDVGQPTGSYLRIICKQVTAGGSTGYAISLGDEDGINWLSQDKWYQVAFSISPTAVSWAVNGSTSAKNVETINNLSILNIGDAARTCFFGSSASASSSFIESINYGNIMPSCMVSASAWSDKYLDLNDEHVRGRIFDDNGDFKNPGENGSLWFGDNYGDHVPIYYFGHGTPRVQNGTDTGAWRIAGSNNSTGYWGAPGGLRKQYE